MIDRIRSAPTLEEHVNLREAIEKRGGLAWDRGMIPDLDAPVVQLVPDEVFESERNRQITWRMLLQQTSEWEGNMFGKDDTFIGKDAFGQGEMKPLVTTPSIATRPRVAS